MKTIGLIGGMSWESSKVYYELINEKVKNILGGFHSCKCLLYSVDFAEVEHLQHEDNWEELDRLMADAAIRLEKAGADFVLLCTNTMHLCSNAIEQCVSIPFLHIAEATGEQISRQGIKKIGLLGTKFTMEKDFYSLVLSEKFGIETMIPDEKDRDVIHTIIYEELVHGKIMDASRTKYKEIIGDLMRYGAEGIILGCTEIPLLINQQDVPVQVFDTTKIHAHKAVEWALEEQLGSSMNYK